MSDLIERLRYKYADILHREAADALEAKDAEIETLEGGNKILGQWVEDNDKRIAELAEDNERLRAALEQISLESWNTTNRRTRSAEIARETLAKLEASDE